jgi:hypothetical protein
MVTPLTWHLGTAAEVFYCVALAVAGFLAVGSLLRPGYLKHPTLVEVAYAHKYARYVWRPTAAAWFFDCVGFVSAILFGASLVSDGLPSLTLCLLWLSLFSALHFISEYYQKAISNPVPNLEALPRFLPDQSYDAPQIDLHAWDAVSHRD